MSFLKAVSTLLKLRTELGLATEEYQMIVDLCADNGVSAPLPNRSIKHAKILVRKIFEKAQSDVRIISGSFDEFFIGHVEDSIREAIKRNPSIHVSVIVIDGDKLNGRAKDLNQLDNFSFYVVPENLRNTTQKDQYHFCTADDMYRKEMIHPVGQDFSKNPEIHARANFNSPEQAAELRARFDSLKSKCVPCK